MNYDDILALDEKDPLKHCKDLFQERPGFVHLDANSLGSMPKSVPEHLAQVLQHEWADERSASWAAASWMARPMQIGAAISRLIGAAPEDTLAYDNTTLNLFKLLTDALKLNPDRQVILSEKTTFPTNLHVAQGLENAHSDRLKVVYADPEKDILDAITEDVAVVYLSQVDYRSGRRFNMQEINAKARSVGALTSGISHILLARFRWTWKAHKQILRLGAVINTCVAGPAVRHGFMSTKSIRTRSGQRFQVGSVMQISSRFPSSLNQQKASCAI